MPDKLQSAAEILEQVGYRWTGSAWEIPHSADLPRARQLSTIDVGDLLCSQLIGLMPDGDEALAARLQGLHELWDGATGYNSRHMAK